MAAFEIPFVKWPRNAGADLRLKQYHGLIMSGANVISATVGARIVGVQQNKPNINQAVEIQSGGITKVELGGTVTAGADVAMDATGRFIVAAGAAAIVGQCIVGGDVSEIGCVILLGSVAADPRSHFILVQDVDISGGTSRWIVSPVAGNIARVRTIVTTVLAAGGEAGLVTLELATVLVVGSNVVIAALAAVGDTDDSGAIGAGGTTLVAAGDAIEVVNDGTPTSGVVTVVIEIVPT